MKNKVSKLHISLTTLALAFAFVSPIGALAASPKEGAMMPPAQSAERSSAMRQHHDTMMSEMRNQDTELANQISAIKSAPENKKMALMVKLLSDMVEQRAAMHENMSEMMENMRNDRPMKSNGMSSIQMMKGPSRQASSAADNDKE